MTFRFNLSDSEPDQAQSPTTTTQCDVEWLPLKSHPVFSGSDSSSDRPPRSLMAWDGDSRLYFWDADQLLLHRISVRLGEPEPTSVLAASPSKVLRPEMELEFEVLRISINRDGSALLLSGSDALCVMFLYGRSSFKNNAIICRTVVVGPEIYSKGGSALCVLQVLWHPYSDTHLGILSSDSVFRLFDLSSNLIQPEQEYYLQPTEPGSHRNATSICPVDFSFGGEHLWDRFSVFILFSDGSVYILCPVVPFGSVYKWEYVIEIYNDAHMFGLNSANSAAVRNSNLAISWLEATFPDLALPASEGHELSAIKARPYALFDASLSLQGPLRKVSDGDNEDFSIRDAECEGRAVSFLFNTVSKDSVLVTAWSGGQLQIDALADEIQPIWTIESPPRVRFDSAEHITGLAMICESTSGSRSVDQPQPLDNNTVWLGHPPPLLRLAIVDLALPKQAEGSAESAISMFADPLTPERIYSVHKGGIDSIVLHFLPFTCNGKNAADRNPSVFPVLSTCQGKTASSYTVSGCVPLSDSFGYSWIVGVTSSLECFVLEMKTWNLLLPVHIDVDGKPSESESEERQMPDIISKELLSGPKVVLLPQTPSNLRSVTADSIEGRSTLHQYFKLFHENYVEYAHKVYFEIKHHGSQLKRIIDDQNARLSEAHNKISKVEERQLNLENRIVKAVQKHNALEERLNQLRSLPGAHRKPLSRAEREFKSELGQFSSVELDALRSSISALSARLKRNTHSSSASDQRKLIARRKSHAQDSQISVLKSSLEKLSLVNSQNSNKVKLVESALKNREAGR